MKTNLRWLALALLALSLSLPVAYGAEIFGIMRGWLFVLIPPFTLLYVPVPISLLLARRRPAVGAVLGILSCFGWGYVLATQGVVIDAFVSRRRVFASGTLCALAASVLATYVSLAFRRAVSKEHSKRIQPEAENK